MAVLECVKDFIKYLTLTQRLALSILLTTQINTLKAKIISLTTLSLQETVLATLANTTLDTLQDALNAMKREANKVPFSEFSNCPGVVELGDVFQDTIKTAQRRINKVSTVAQEAIGRQPASQMRENMLELVESLEEQLAYIISLGD